MSAGQEPLDAEVQIARKRRHRNERIAAGVLVAVVCAAALATILWRRHEDAAYRAVTTYIPKPPRITPSVELLAEYLRIDTSTPAGAAEGARWLASQLEKAGIRPEIIESVPGRLNVHARIRGRSPGGGLLLFNHIDVVPPGDGWTQPPFGAKIQANQLYGRGAIDMKGLAICQLLAFLDVARSGVKPAHDLVFLATADEETGSAYGMKWILENRRDVLEGVAFGITEGGVTEMMTEQMTYFGIEIGGKQMTQLILRAPSVEALQNARFAFEPYIASREPGRVIPEVRRFFRSIAPTRMAFKPHLEDIDKTIREGRFWQLPSSYRDLTQNSLFVDAPFRSGPNWEMRVRMLSLPDEKPEERLAWLSAIAERHGATIDRIESQGVPCPLSSADTPLFSILASRASARYRVPAGTQILFKSTSDARFLRPLGIECYGVSPYPVDYFQSLTIHQMDERVRLDYFNDGVDYLSEVVRDWAATD